MRTMHSLAIALSLLSTQVGAAPRSHHRHDSTWVRNCVAERTGPDGGMPRAEAQKACRAEEPEDEIAAAKRQLSIAKANAKLLKAKARARKAIEACHQVVVDVCVDGAKPDGSTDCMDEALEQQFLRICGSGTSFATEGK